MCWSAGEPTVQGMDIATAPPIPWRRAPRAAVRAFWALEKPEMFEVAFESLAVVHDGAAIERFGTLDGGPEGCDHQIAGVRRPVAARVVVVLAREGQPRWPRSAGEDGRTVSQLVQQAGKETNYFYATTEFGSIQYE